MIAQNQTVADTLRRTIVRLLDSIALVIAASAGIILFIATPYALLDRWHALPNWDIFWLFFMFAPIVVAWDHAGVYLILTATACQLVVIALKPQLSSRNKKMAAGSIAICVVTYLWLYIGKRFNIH